MITAICAGLAATLDPSARAHQWPVTVTLVLILIHKDIAPMHVLDLVRYHSHCYRPFIVKWAKPITQCGVQNPTATRKSTQKPSANLHKMREPEPPDEASTGGSRSTSLQRANVAFVLLPKWTRALVD
jgi:hypothetical protein